MDEIRDVKRCVTCLHDLPIQAFDPIKIDGKYVMKDDCRLCAKTKAYRQEVKERREANKIRMTNFDAWMILDKKYLTPIGDWYYRKRAKALAAKKEIGDTVIVRRVKINILNR